MTSVNADALNQFQGALPDVTSTLRLAGLEGPVEVHRDRLGIPHTRAGSTYDAFFAQGFVHAQDRLWQMDYDRRRAAGTAAAWAGKGVLDHDILMRRLRLDASARADYAAFDPDTKAMMDAYADGVNAFIGTTATLPAEYTLLGVTPEPWEAWQSGAIFKVRHVLMGTWGSKLWRARLLQALGQDTVTKLGARGNEDGVVIVPPGEAYHAALHDVDLLTAGIQALAETPEFGGSNNWAVHGTRTASGKPLVAGDPHRMIDVPNVYYQNHLACPEFDVIGYAFAGIPGFPHFGHNGSVAWCITHASADYQDLYVERFQNDAPNQYEVEGDWQQAETHQETIEVRGGEPVKVTTTITRHGPIVIGDPASGHAIAMHYTALDEPNPGLQCILPMMHAKNLDEMEEAQRDWVDPCNSLTMADVDGNIGYFHRGRVPVRNRANGWLPVPGWTGEHEWDGDIPFEELPRSRNPETGWIGTANNRVVGDDYPHYLSLDYAPPHRALRVTARLDVLENATIDDMGAIHSDRVSLPSRLLVAALAKVTGPDVRSELVRTRLLGWDGVMDKDQVAPALYAVTREHLTRLVLDRQLLAALRENPYKGEPLPLGPAFRMWANLLNLLADNDTSILDDGDTWESLLSEALANATAFLTETLGDDMDAWRWERLHITKPIHPLSASFPEQATLLNPPSVSLGGDSDTVQAAGSIPGIGYTIAGTSVARYAFDLGDWDNSRWVVPLGSSGHPGSPHFSDQSRDWSAVTNNPMTYSWDRVVSEAQTTQRLEP